MSPEQEAARSVTLPQQILGWKDAAIIVASVVAVYLLFFTATDRIETLSDAGYRVVGLGFDLLTVGLIAGLVRVRGFPVLSTLRFNRLGRRNAVMLLLLAVGLALASFGYAALIEVFRFLPDWWWDVPSDAPASSSGWFIQTASDGFSGPLLEEALFRGVIQPVAVSSFGVFWGILSTSLLFGLSHLVPLPAIGHALWGFAVGFAVYRSGSLLSGVFLHSANNVLVLVTEYLSEVPDTDTIGPSPSAWELSMILLLIGVGAVVSVCALRRMKKEASGSLASLPEI